jgi:hypothetical protein
MKKYSLSAVVAAGLMAGGLATSANAADLGGNCCADLEERVAELEATTARKGNRKVSLTISGWVGEQVMWWDDGVESNTYVGGLGTTIGTNVKFTGQATIVPGWSAGYVIHIEADGNDGLATVADGWSATNDNSAGVYAKTTNYVQTLQAFWFVKSDHWGKVSVGMQSQASDNTAILVDGSGSLIPANFVQFDYNNFFIRTNAGGTSAFKWGGALGCTDCNGLPLNAVRYDTPTFAGFSASASWGEDDFWDIALRYAGEHHGFKLAAAAAYSESTDVGTQGVTAFSATGVAETDFFQIGAYIQHVGTGLFLYGAYGTFDGDPYDGQTGVHFVDHDFWYIKGGIRGKWNHLGATIPYIEYEESNDGAFAVVANGTTNNSEFELWGVGIVQEIDAAAMSMWLKYRHLEADITSAGVNQDLDDFDYVSFGALINF